MFRNPERGDVFDGSPNATPEAQIDIPTYLNRIGCDGPLTLDADILRALQVAHLYTVSFENLSIFLDEPIVLDVEPLFDKVVARRRGGFCYELKGLFAALLRSLGFRVDMVSARVRGSNQEYGPPFDHLTLLVSLSERWLDDVGFGDSFLELLRLDETGVQPQGECCYRVLDDKTELVLESKGREGKWTPQYRFGTKAYHLADFAERCRYYQSSPESHFTKNTVCTMAALGGRLTITGTRLITTTGGERIECELPDKPDYSNTLREQFNIVIDKG
ncbi:MAG: arylamine N-acetyltransferase [Gemmatimonadota bacterium]|nr:arylamine N-acetyltransferase [Gemmatimonadota bacterium]